LDKRHSIIVNCSIPRAYTQLAYTRAVIISENAQISRLKQNNGTSLALANGHNSRSRDKAPPSRSILDNAFTREL